MNVINILKYLEQLAPLKYAEKWDNCGLLAGNSTYEVKKIIVALDASLDVIEQAIMNNVQLVVTHHPIFFSTKSITEKTSPFLRLLENKIAVICMHTNLDSAKDGVNEMLAKSLNLIEPMAVLHPLEQDVNAGLGRFAELSAETDLIDFVKLTKIQLNSGCIRYFDAGLKVKRVAVSSGSGAVVSSGENLLETAKNKGCDTFVTGDVKHSIFVQAKEIGINLIDAGHFATENVIISVLCDKLKINFPELEIISSGEEPFKCH